MRQAFACLAVWTVLVLSIPAESRADVPFLMRGYRPGHVVGNTVRAFVWGPSMSPSRGMVSSARRVPSGR
jgi:hypothetical protein